MSTPDPTPRPPLVLVADDDPTTRILVCGTLEEEGFAVAEAEDGDQALQKFEALRPDLVLLDVLMPRRDGFSACEAIRALPYGKSVPVLMMTALEDTESIRRAFDAGATDFAAKPISWSLLGHRVRYLLRGKAALDEVRRSEARLARAQELAGLGSFETDDAVQFVRWSAGLKHVLGLEHGAGPFHIENYLQRVHPQDVGKVERALDALRHGDAPADLEHRILTGASEPRHVLLRLEQIVSGDASATGIAGVVQDVTERVGAERQIRYLAFHDSLTGLPNRNSFTERVRIALSDARRSGRPVAVLFVDLDDFKCVNDSLGHDAGDQLLTAVGQRFRQLVRATDEVGRATFQDETLFVARLGGDEFLLLLTDLARAEDAVRVARRILKSLEEPFRIRDHEVFVDACIGISVYPHDGTGESDLLKNADTALYHAKGNGRGSLQFYDSAMNASALQRLALEGSLRRAVEREEFVLHYQPQLRLPGRQIVGVEALVRWRHPDLGFVPPAQFIPIAEQTGMIHRIGEWVLCEAARQALEWRNAGIGPLRIAVNLSSIQFKSANLAKLLTATVRDRGLEPSDFELEITESVLMESATKTLVTLMELKAAGFHIAIDDFGTGYSSLAYLKQFPIDVLKIDRAFVRDLAEGTQDASIVEAILAIARALGLDTVAEGVETDAQCACLLERGCTLMQGYLFGRPLPPEDLTSRLAEQVETAGVS